MGTKFIQKLPLLLFGLVLSQSGSAHTPICYCYIDDDERITCEGGFSDGASAEGVGIRVLDDRDKLLISSKMDEQGLFSFEEPQVDFYVVFDGGENHAVTVFMDEIE